LGYDAWVIAKHMLLPLESFLITFPAKEQNEYGFLLAPGGTRYEIALDKIGKYQKGNPCIFWMPLSTDHGRCGIYPCRPLVCQTYPAYQQQEIVALRDDVYCPARSWNLAGMDVASFRRRLYRFRMERDIYAYTVQAWNRSVEASPFQRNLSQFYTFLMNLYEHLDEARRLIPAGTFQKIVQQWGELSLSMPNPLAADLTPPNGNQDWHEFMANVRATVECYVATFRKIDRPLAVAAI
jgi:Fe-S-cluster containining protein